MSLSEIMKSLAKIASKNPKGRRWDDQGRYHPDPTPIAPPVGYTRSPSIADQIRTMVRSEALRQHAESQGQDTFEEADDFNIGDDYDPRSPWEEQFEGQFDIPLPPQEPPARDPGDRNPPTPPQPPESQPKAVPEPPEGVRDGSRGRDPAPPAKPGT